MRDIIDMSRSMYLILTFYVSFDSHDDCFLIPQPTPGPSTAQPTNAPTTTQPTNPPTTAQPTANPTLPPTPAPTNEVRRYLFIYIYMINFTLFNVANC